MNIDRALQAAGAVAGIGGICAVVFLVIGRQMLITRGLFPRLDRRRAFRLLNLLIILAGAIALAGIICWTIIQVQPHNGLHGELGLVGVSLYEGTNSFATGEASHIELRLRNTSPEVVYLKSAELSIKHLWRIHVPRALSGVVVTADYRVPIPGNLEPPWTTEVKIDQKISSNDVDRFTFTIGTASDSLSDVIYHLGITLVYDEDDKKLTVPDLVLLVPCRFESRGYTLISGLRGVADWEQAIQGLRSVNATRSATIAEMERVWPSMFYTTLRAALVDDRPTDEDVVAIIDYLCSEFKAQDAARKVLNFAIKEHPVEHVRTLASETASKCNGF